MNTDFATTWNTYTSAWQAASQPAMLELFGASVHPECHYSDPLADAAGWQALSAYMLDLQRQIPGVHFMTTQFTAHHHKSMAKWHMLDGQDNILGEGVSFGEFAPDGKLLRMTGFFDLPPAA